MKIFSIGNVAGCAAILLSGSLALAADNWVGTWKLNLAKSKYSPGPGPKSLTLKFEATDAAIRLTSEGVNAEGNATHGGYTSKFDGNEVPFAGNPQADTATLKRIDDNAYQNAWKKAGKATITSKGVVSKDGKTLTVTSTGKNVKGETVNNVAVYDRQ